MFLCWASSSESIDSVESSTPSSGVVFQPKSRFDLSRRRRKQLLIRRQRWLRRRRKTSLLMRNIWLIGRSIKTCIMRVSFHTTPHLTSHRVSERPITSSRSHPAAATRVLPTCTTTVWFQGYIFFKSGSFSSRRHFWEGYFLPQFKTTFKRKLLFWESKSIENTSKHAKIPAYKLN